ncbi:MAG: capsular polysaccharide biosynthesis protein [Desulfovibrionaceae bacterium]|nr:capsular polysaccharide biosynthesis protein [Desulfovibrionaceae bacterium]
MFRLWRYQLRHLRQHFNVSLPKWCRVLASGLSTPTLICFSKGLARIPNLEALVRQEVLYLPSNSLADWVLKREAAKISGVLLWGQKEDLEPLSLTNLLKEPSFKGVLGFFKALKLYLTQHAALRASKYALAIASRYNLKVIRAEDGFLRSLNLGILGAAPLSLVLDQVGIYYDASRPSDLENLLNSSEDFSKYYPEVKAAISLLKKYHLSKYNQALDFDPQILPQDDKSRILVIDQTYGDLSLKLGQVTPDTFKTMLACALEEHPNAHIFLKIHPDVLCGRKLGHFNLASLPSRVKLIAQDVAPLSLLPYMDQVYTATSQMGFEALLLGKKVHCFGLPYYAGWGLTQDRLTLKRRKRKRSLEDVFYAAYFRYANYVQPAISEKGEIFQTIELLKSERKVNLENRGYHACLGFRRWKHSHARAFLASTLGRTEFFTSPLKALQAAKAKQGAVVIWASKVSSDFWKLKEEFQVPVWRMEDGFLRSVGLGSDFYRPGSLVLDDLGIYYDPNHLSRLEKLLLEPLGEEELTLAQTLQKLLVEKGISKYNLKGQNDLDFLPKDRSLILVPGQVEDDASVKLGGLGIYSNLELLKAVRSANPNAYIIYKEHPDVVSGNRVGHLEPKNLKGLADLALTDFSIEACLAKVDEVHTLTSLTGFEALLRGKKVYTYGGPFYAGYGLTIDRHKFPRRKPLPSLLHLIYGALVAYPRYYDWKNGLHLDCLAYLAWLAKARSNVYKAKEII